MTVPTLKLLYISFIKHKRAREFLDTKTKGKPFFMMLSTPACHGPFTPAPQYNNSFSDKQAPRNGSYNVKAEVSILLFSDGFSQPDKSNKNVEVHLLLTLKVPRRKCI